jgi:hypothetical protein
MGNRGVRFDEQMAGWLAVPHGDLVDSQQAWLTMRAAVIIADLDAFLADPSHRGELVGHVDFDMLGQNIPAQGHVELFAPGKSPGSRVMRYQLTFVVAKVTYQMIGTKFVNKAAGYNAWHHTTTLFTAIMNTTLETPVPIAAGVVRLSLWQGTRMLMTLRGLGSAPLSTRLAAVGRFAWFFVAEVAAAYLPRTAPSVRPT